MNEVCYSTLNLHEPWSLAAYESVGGYRALKKIVNEKLSPQEAIRNLIDFF